MSKLVDYATVREEAALAGEYIYERSLKSVLQPNYSGQFVAIYIPTRDFVVAGSLKQASDRLREKYPNAARGEVYTRRVGDQPVMRIRTPRVAGK